MPTNHAVWQDNVGMPGIVREEPVPKIEDQQILVKVRTWAMNPCDAMLQDTPLPFVKYPVVLGQDIAGTVEAVGAAAAAKFKAGERVFAFSGGNNSFQSYARSRNRWRLRSRTT